MFLETKVVRYEKESCPQPMLRAGFVQGRIGGGLLLCFVRPSDPLAEQEHRLIIEEPSAEERMLTALA